MLVREIFNKILQLYLLRIQHQEASLNRQPSDLQLRVRRLSNWRHFVNFFLLISPQLRKRFLQTTN